MREDKLKQEKVYTVFSLTEANKIKALLSQNGIEHFVENENSSVMLSHLGNVVSVAFWVATEDKDKTINLLEKNVKKSDEKRLNHLDMSVILIMVVICVLGVLTSHPDIPTEISEASFYVSCCFFVLSAFYVITKLLKKPKNP